jgi:uncharacterized membrane protein YgcG
MRFFALALLTLISLVRAAGAEERITSFVSEATIGKDASVTLTETISVIAEGAAIKHGIFRDIPTRYRDRHGFRVNVGLEVSAARRDGHDESYSVESISNGKRIRIGSADLLVEPGSHTYEITYRVNRVIGFFGDYDEFYWNVTGNAWEFPIDYAAVVVNLPPGATIMQHAEYTGAEGAQGRDFQFVPSASSVYRAHTTRTLGAREGFTIAVAWPKGFVTVPTESERWQWFLADNASLFVLIAGLIVVGLYYLFAWLKVGRDPPRGVIVPLFAPPPGMGPAAVRFVWRENFDDRTFAAAVVGLAVKGRAQIIQEGSEYTIKKQSGGKGEALTPAEAALYNALPSILTLKQSNHTTVSAVRAALRKSLVKDFDGVAFLRNRGWFWAGALLSIAVLALMALSLPGEDAVAGLMITVWGGIWWGVVLTFLVSMVRGVMAKGFISRIGSVLGLLFLIPFVFAGVAGPALVAAGAGSPGLYTLIAAAVLFAALNVLFFWLLKAPTVSGRNILDQIEGFRMYLKTAEEDRLNVLNPPEKTPELFERFLPYALALDCENEWNAKFTAVLAAAAAAGATAPLWYSGSNWDAGRTTSFTDSLGSGLASSTAAASSAPGSSSGSSGGGSSGGGGGGGGGGGW